MYIEDKMNILEQKLDLLIKMNGGDTIPMTVKDVAEMYGKARTGMYSTYRYLLPNYGVDADGTVVNEWTRREVIEWNSKPLAARKKELKGRVFPTNKKS